MTRNIDGQEVRYFHTKKNGVDRVWIDNDAFLAKVQRSSSNCPPTACESTLAFSDSPCTLLQVWGKTGGKLYGQRSGSDYSDNQKRFVLFNKAAIEALTALPFGPGEDCVVVANDWHTAMFPVLLKVDQGIPCSTSSTHSLLIPTSMTVVILSVVATQVHSKYAC